MIAHTLENLKSGALIGATSLKLSCNLKTFPQEIFELHDTLELLDLSNNQLKELPLDIGRLKKLKIVFFSQNKFTIYPQQLHDCVHLQMIGFKSNQIEIIPEDAFNNSLKWLILTDNQIKTLPQNIGHCIKLQKCMLSGNQLAALPDSMRNCVNLELLRISNNQLQRLPTWIFDLPKLAWLAFSSNNFNTTNQQTAALAELDWQDVTLGKQIGEGASGNIYRANLNTKINAQLPIAVKIFKGNITSDGLPTDEVTATTHAGAHPSLTNCYGIINNHPEGKLAIVLDLIPEYYSILAKPPSFQTCTRDVYSVETTFTKAQVIAMAQNLASVLAHLHRRSISHGDFYAHNILVSDTHATLLTDFGAASIYTQSQQHAQLIQLIEVNAYGILLQELLQRLSTQESIDKQLVFLHRLAINCTDRCVTNRPSFEEISQQLRQL